MDFDSRIERRGTNSEKWDGQGEVFGRDDILPLWVADMDFACPPQVTETLVNRARHGIFGYTLRGEGYYSAARHWYSSRHGWEIPGNSLLDSAGVVNGMSMALRALTEKGDSVVIQPPVYGPFYKIVRANERQLRENPLVKTAAGWKMDFEDLERKLAGARVFMLCSPHNPVGRVWTKEELEKVADLCERHDVLIFSDEIHGDLVLRGHRYLPLVKVCPQAADRTVTFVAPSKTFNLAGLSTSLMVITRKKLYRRVAAEISAAGMHMGNTFGIEGLEAAYRHGGPWLDELLEYIEGNIDWVLEQLGKRLPFIRAEKPEGTYLLWLDFRSLGVKHTELVRLMVEDCGLGLTSGRFFGTGGEGFLRLNAACPRAYLEEAVAKMEKGIGEKRDGD